MQELRTFKNGLVFFGPPCIYLSICVRHSQRLKVNMKRSFGTVIAILWCFHCVGAQFTNEAIRLDLSNLSLRGQDGTQETGQEGTMHGLCPILPRSFKVSSNS